jgi:LysR family transcriptional regulator, hydrogen peroxide-inducible genes activator
MTLQQLEYIVALDTYRHFVTAAENCFVTQPTITIQVQKLEDELGIVIFNRNKTPLQPTELGEIFIAKSRTILMEVKQLKEMVSDERENIKGKFRVGIIPTVSPYIVPKFIGSFMEKHPESILDIDEMQSDAIIEGLKNGKIDLGILVTPTEENSLREIPLYKEPFVYYGNDIGSTKIKKSISYKDIESLHGLWLLNSGHCFRNQVLNICKEPKNLQNITFKSGSIETLMKMVNNYGGFTLIPEMAISDAHQATIIHFDDPKPIREVSIVVHKSFVKESLIEALRFQILNIVPKNFEKNKRYIKINWR